MGFMPIFGEFAESLYRNYNHFKVREIEQRRFTPDELTKTLLTLTAEDMFRVYDVGSSAEGHTLRLVKAGWGPTKVFLWSQMHGDEATATQALLDIIRFMTLDDHFNHHREKILRHLTIYILPMVNPDGAIRFQRENSAGIDLNRDAKDLATPEANILLSTFRKIQPEYAFNLHDQDPRYSLGSENRQAAISFLAPPPDAERSVNTNRERAMKLISGISGILRNIIPGHIGKYSDEYEERAFGDLFQSMGAATVLIESGAWKDDREKQFIRQLNVIALLSSFALIAHGHIEKFDVKGYDGIPFNERKLYDVILRGVQKFAKRPGFVTDIAINIYDEPSHDGKSMHRRSQIEEVGGLHDASGICEIACADMAIAPPLHYMDVIKSFNELKGINAPELIKQGITTLFYGPGCRFPEGYVPELTLIPRQKNGWQPELKPGDPAEFLLTEKGKSVVAIHNGIPIFLPYVSGELGNGFIVN